MKTIQRIGISAICCVGAVLLICNGAPMIATSFTIAIGIAVVLLPTLIFNGKPHSLGTYKRALQDIKPPCLDVNYYRKKIMDSISSFERMRESLEKIFYLNYSSVVLKEFITIQALCEEKMCDAVKRAIATILTMEARGQATDTDKSELSQYMGFIDSLLEEMARINKSATWLEGENRALDQIRFFTDSLWDLSKKYEM